jgi:hypothetical protein
MDKKTFISNLKNIADVLDNKNMFVQAEKITNVLVKLAQEDDDPDLRHNLPDQLIDGDPAILKEIGQPEVSPRVNTRTINVDGDIVNVPNDLRIERTFGRKSFTLHYDKDTKRMFYKSADGKEILPLDAEGKVRETRPKRYDFWKQIGGRGLFGDLKLPNLNKSVPIEPYLRKKLIPEVAKVVRPLGDAAKQVITRPITDTLGEITDDAGISVPGRDTPSAAGAKKDLGQSEDRSTVSKDAPLFSTEVPGAKNNIQDPDGKIDAVEPGKYDGKPAKDGSGGADGADIKISKTQLKDIQTADDLLFWSMMTGNNIPYSSYSKDNEKEYYNTKNKSKTLNYLNKLTSSNYVYRINPKIRQMKNEAETLLYSKTASKTMNRQILASMNEICNELELLGMDKAASDVTILMKKYAQMEEDQSENFADTPQVTAWKNFARSLAKKDPDFIPPIKPNISMITYADVTDKALSEYRSYKNNKKQTSKFTYQEENQLKTLAQNADRAR